MSEQSGPPNPGSQKRVEVPFRHAPCPEQPPAHASTGRLQSERLHPTSHSHWPKRQRPLPEQLPTHSGPGSAQSGPPRPGSQRQMPF